MYVYMHMHHDMYVEATCMYMYRHGDATPAGSPGILVTTVYSFLVAMSSILADHACERYMTRLGSLSLRLASVATLRSTGRRQWCRLSC